MPTSSNRVKFEENFLTVVYELSHGPANRWVPIDLKRIGINPTMVTHCDMAAFNDIKSDGTCIGGSFYRFSGSTLMLGTEETRAPMDAINSQVLYVKASFIGYWHEHPEITKVMDLYSDGVKLWAKRDRNGGLVLQLSADVVGVSRPAKGKRK